MPRTPRKRTKKVTELFIALKDSCNNILDDASEAIVGTVDAAEKNAEAGIDMDYDAGETVTIYKLVPVKRLKVPEEHKFTEIAL